MDSSLPDSSIHRISQARTPEWVAIFSSKGSFKPRDQTWVFRISCSGMWTRYHWATWEAPIFCWGLSNFEQHIPHGFNTLRAWGQQLENYQSKQRSDLGKFLRHRQLCPNPVWHPPVPIEVWPSWPRAACLWGQRPSGHCLQLCLNEDAGLESFPGLWNGNGENTGEFEEGTKAGRIIRDQRRLN